MPSPTRRPSLSATHKTNPQTSCGPWVVKDTGIAYHHTPGGAVPEEYKAIQIHDVEHLEYLHAALGAHLEERRQLEAAYAMLSARDS